MSKRLLVVFERVGRLQLPFIRNTRSTMSKRRTPSGGERFTWLRLDFAVELRGYLAGLFRPHTSLEDDFRDLTG